MGVGIGNFCKLLTKIASDFFDLILETYYVELNRLSSFVNYQIVELFRTVPVGNLWTM